MEKIKVLIADDHRVVREGLAAILKTKDDINVVGEAQDGVEAVEKAKTLEPDVILMDVSMPRMGGIEATRQIKREFPHMGIVALTMYEEQQYIFDLVRAGATGYLLKDAFPTDIATTVHDLVAGHSPISASIARFIVRRTQKTAEPPPGPPLNTTKLTPREIDILWGIAKGFSYAEIAVHLGLSRQTVPGHIKSIYRKLEVHTRGEAVFEAVQQGLIKL